jgi:transcriptional regulator
MLTEKEIEVLRYVQKGFNQMELAKKLKITQPAVSKFYSSAIKKIKEAKETIELSKTLGIK